MKPSGILFLNQVTGPLFRELAEDVAREIGHAELLTGNSDEISCAEGSTLRLRRAPHYDRRSLAHRACSWVAYFLQAAVTVFRSDRRHVLFIVSNPPFLPLVGWLAAVVRQQRYCVLVYDLYPGVLVQLGRISPRSPIALLWRLFNRLVWNRAHFVFTIGDYMAESIRREGAGLDYLNVRVISNWADVAFVKPLPQSRNAFRQGLGWADRTIVLYSGNLGNTHNLDGLLRAAVKLRTRADLGFLIIGAGARWDAVRREIETRQLTNVRLLPLQPEALLPQTLPTGDIAVVAMENAIAGYMVPSKTYYALAAGSALLALVPKRCEIADLVARGECGVRVDGDDADGIVRALEHWLAHPEKLAACRQRARALAERDYSRRNSHDYVVAMRELLGGEKHDST